MADLQSWENGVQGQVLDTDHIPNDKGQCSQVPISWAELVYPGVAWSVLLPEAMYVFEWAGRSTKYFTWIANNPKDANQLPLPGDVPVFGPTPAKGYTMAFKNIGGHTGVIKAASVSGYTLVEQNEPVGSGVHDASYPWTLRPCLGWFRATSAIISTPAPAPIVPAPAAVPISSPIVGQWVNFPATVTSWWAYNAGGPYDAAHHAHVLMPKKYGGYSRQVSRDLGNGLYLIHTDMYGDVAVWATAPLTVTGQPQLATA